MKKQTFICFQKRIIMINKYTLLFVAMLVVTIAQAGNPDRQGEAGAAQLLIYPWARNAGLFAMNTAAVQGIEAAHLNPAGLSRINNTEIGLSHTNYFQGTGISVNAFGLAQKVGKNGAFGLSLMSVGLGEIPVTTEASPEGTGANFSPSIVNIGATYSHSFENKVSVGVTFRGVSESLANVSAFAVAIDAGVQYVTGARDNFKIGIALRNVGSKMQQSGEGLLVKRPNPTGNFPYTLPFNKNSQAYELPSMLNIGLSYDVYFAKKTYFRFLGNFTSNSFSRDHLSGGGEFSLNDMFQIRGGYRYVIGSEKDLVKSVQSGIAAGVTVALPLKKDSKNNLSIDYSYQHTRIWGGNHALGLRIGL
jgi:long-subunit fatty acid transport protein